jgi:hypothetical protein
MATSSQTATELNFGGGSSLRHFCMADFIDLNNTKAYPPRIPTRHRYSVEYGILL